MSRSPEIRSTCQCTSLLKAKGHVNHAIQQPPPPGSVPRFAEFDGSDKSETFKRNLANAITLLAHMIRKYHMLTFMDITPSSCY